MARGSSPFREPTYYLPLSDRLMRVTMSSQAYLLRRDISTQWTNRPEKLQRSYQLPPL